ncbi:pimeloyl-ACP methyl ester esterase BioH [Methylothermus subterraneus]
MSRLDTASFGQGLPLVLIPGWAMHSKVWGEFAARLARKFRVTCVELPGHGASPAWPEWTLAATAEALAEVAPGGAVWLGWSLGGQVALELARRYPTKAKALVLLATNPKFLAEGDWPGLAPEVFAEFAQGIERAPQSTLQRFLTLCCLGADSAPKLLGRLRAAWNRRPSPSPAVLRQGLEILRGADLRAALAHVGCPVAVAAGEQDRLVPAAAAERLAACLPRARRMVLKGAGHALFLSHPQELAALVEEVAA